MSRALTVIAPESAPELPAIITREGGKATKRFLEFFTASIRNPNTRLSYMRAIVPFLAWCEERGASLHQIEPMIVAAYIERLTQERAPQTVKQHLAAIRMLFDWLVTGQVVPFNPAASVRGPRYSIKKGKTPVLSAQETRKLLDSIDTTHVVGLRDRALIGTMVYSFARVSAIVNMRVRDYYPQGKRYWIRLHEKGRKFHEVPVHHTAESYLDEYLKAAGISEERSYTNNENSRSRAEERRTRLRATLADVGDAGFLRREFLEIPPGMGDVAERPLADTPNEAFGQMARLIRFPARKCALGRTAKEIERTICQVAPAPGSDGLTS